MKRDGASQPHLGPSEDAPKPENTPGKVTLTGSLPSVVAPRPAEVVDAGKATLTAAIPMERDSVQRKQSLGTALSTEATHTAAAAGVRGSGDSLPHRERIQALFGAHDISDVRAHVGGDAAVATEAIGARAYATGRNVAFASAPDLHTSAHEAAHVVQQRGTVQLKGGIGEAGDAHERHADAVADRVVQGASAADLLDQVAPAGAAVSAAGVQRLQLALDADLRTAAGAHRSMPATCSR